MAKFIIHDAEGNILRTGDAPDDELDNQVLEDHEMILKNVTAETHHKVCMETKNILTEGTFPSRALPKTVATGGVSDERLRAMIYSVLMEIEEARTKQA